MTVSPEARIRDTLRSLLVQMSPKDIQSVSADDRLVEDLGYDSLTLIELAVAIEDRFDLPAISEEEAMRIRTVGDLEQFIANSSGSAVTGAHSE
ncbi:MAG TPA: phosphopantetheine-binding protein [Solirubrobacteraceae bacterium]|jgi:acyl carrier protein